MLATFLPAHVVVQAPGATPTVTALLLHGILGSGRNLRSIAQRLCAEVPSLRCVLVDLRNHGDSIDAPPPHTLEACAADLQALARHLDVAPQVVIGHSFGGKVALVYAAKEPAGLRQVWLLDATPDALPEGDAAPDDDEGVAGVIRVLQDLAMPQPTRQAVAEALQQRGVAPAIAQWLTTNLKPVAGGFAWKFDLTAVRQMLASYLATDLWSVLRQPPAGVRIDVVRATRERRWTPAILRGFIGLPQTVHLHALDAGHWLHVDDPDGLVRLLVPSLKALDNA